MKIRIRFYCALCLLLAVSQLAKASDAATDFFGSAGSWKVAFPKEMPAKVAVVPDGMEGKPALKIEVAEGQVESWKGKVSHSIALPAAGSYTIAFFAKVEPEDAFFEVSVWGSVADRPKNVGARMNFKAATEWQEFLYELTAEGPDPAASLTFGNLAKGGRSFFLSDIRITKN
jgi:hypothetical protein